MRSGGILDRRVLAAFDFPLLLVLVSLLGLGLMVLYSAGFDPARPTLLVSFLSYQVENPVFVRQLYYFGLGFVLILVAVALNPQIYMRWSYWVYALCLLLLSAVLLIGSSSHGAQRWLEIAGFRFQPSEPAKLAFVFALARYMSKHIPSNERYRLMSLLVPGVIVLLPVVLILKQPDLGTALSFLAIGLAMILFIGVERRLLLSSGIVGLVSIIPVWSLLRPYQKRRVLALIDPHADPKGSGYHVIQSQIAVGSGEVTGKGYMQGTQTQLEFLPENTTDFVYSVLSEEWGFIGS